MQLSPLNTVIGIVVIDYDNSDDDDDDDNNIHEDRNNLDGNDGE